MAALAIDAKKIAAAVLSGLGCAGAVLPPATRLSERSLSAQQIGAALAIVAARGRRGRARRVVVPGGAGLSHARGPRRTVGIRLALRIVGRHVARIRTRRSRVATRRGLVRGRPARIGTTGVPGSGLGHRTRRAPAGDDRGNRRDVHVERPCPDTSIPHLRETHRPRSLPRARFVSPRALCDVR